MRPSSSARHRTSDRGLPGPAAEDYLKLIFKLSLDGAVAAAAVARARGVSQAAVSKMIAKLRALKLVRGPASAVELTEAGRKIALETIRHHRLLEVYLKEALGYPWDRVDAEAEELEHVISEEFEERIDRLLGHPTHDPHGAPIPTKNGEMDLTRHPRLLDLEAGVKATVQRVSDGDPALLRYLEDVGLVPQASVEVLGREPFDGPLRIRVGPEERQIGEAPARNVFVKPAAGTTVTAPVPRSCSTADVRVNPPTSSPSPSRHS